ncbi:hypothetical protein D3C84_1008630 [compost metagenome]
MIGYFKCLTYILCHKPRFAVDIHNTHLHAFKLDDGYITFTRGENILMVDAELRGGLRI